MGQERGSGCRTKKRGICKPENRKKITRAKRQANKTLKLGGGRQEELNRFSNHLRTLGMIQMSRNVLPQDAGRV